MRTLLFVFLAFTASAMAEAPTYKHFSDAELELIFTYVLALPTTRQPAPEPSTRG